VKNSDEKNFWFQNSNLGSKANKYKEYRVTLSASSWNVPSGCTYAQYSISNDTITENSDICITLPGTGNVPDAVTDWINASVTPGPQYEGKIMIHAYGFKPTHDIAIIMLIGSDTISS
jgi:hypothetical protein